jgi:hypothetical protein
MRRMLLSMVALIAGVGTAAAETPGESQTRAAYTPDGELVRLTTAWGDAPRATVQVGAAKPVELARGLTAGTVVAGHERVVIAVARDSDPVAAADRGKDTTAKADTGGFRIQVIADGAIGTQITVARPGGRDDRPFAVAATPTPDGFTVFFQDVGRADPSAARTYMVTLDAAGAPIGGAVEVPVPWSLAAAAWNGDGYHLALVYTDTRGMRLSMVALTADGQPRQHPDWASRAGFVGDVQLVAGDDGVIRAFYRGGANGDRLHERVVTRIREWGVEPPRAKDRGALAWSKTIAITAAGRATKVAVAAPAAAAEATDRGERPPRGP